MSAAVRTSVSLNSMFKSRPNCLVFSINMVVAARRPGASEFDVIVTRRTVDTEKSLRSEVNGWPDRSDTALLVVHYPFVRAILTSSSARPSCRRACPAINCPNCGGRLVNILWAQPGRFHAFYRSARDDTCHVHACRRCRSPCPRARHAAVTRRPAFTPTRRRVARCAT